MFYWLKSRKIELHSPSEWEKNYFEVGELTYQVLPLGENDPKMGLGVNVEVETFRGFCR